MVPREEGWPCWSNWCSSAAAWKATATPIFRRPNSSPSSTRSAFLTVQEQVDLFSRWGDAGSAAADFLASMALTASGFAQRKPERIAAGP